VLSWAVIQYTGYFISPCGISDLYGTVARMVTLKGNMSTEGETLQVSVLPYRRSICPPLVTYRVPNKHFSHMLDSLGWWPWPASSFHSAPAATVLEFHDYFVCRWFCVVHGPKPPLHHHSWLSFGKFQDTDCFLIPCPCHVLSQLPPSGETCKFATAPSTQKNLERFSFLLCLSWFLCSRVWKFQRDLWIICI
jgi:hypothetical protein